MNKGMFPSMKNVVSFNKEERYYLQCLLQTQLIALASSVADCNEDEEKTIQSILDKLEDQ